MPQDWTFLGFVRFSENKTFRKGYVVANSVYAVFLRSRTLFPHRGVNGIGNFGNTVEETKDKFAKSSINRSETIFINIKFKHVLY